MSINYKNCPKCGSKNSIRFIYGMPSYDLFQKVEVGKVKLGGCEIVGGAPEYFCIECGNEWNRDRALVEAYNKIRKIKASVGGYFGGYYEATIDLVNLKTTWSSWGGGMDRLEKISSIRPSTVANIIGQLKATNILNWKSKYIEPGVCDGTQWIVEILTDGGAKKKHGDNKFPEEWDLFCRTVRRVTRRAFK